MVKEKFLEDGSILSFHIPFTESTFIEKSASHSNGFISAKDDGNIHPKLFSSALRTLLQSENPSSVLQLQNILYNFSTSTMKQVETNYRDY